MLFLAGLTILDCKSSVIKSGAATYSTLQLFIYDLMLVHAGFTVLLDCKYSVLDGGLAIYSTLQLIFLPIRCWSMLDSKFLAA